MAPLEKRHNSVIRYQLVEENLVGNVKDQARDCDLLSVVMLCLGGAAREKYDGVLKLRGVLLPQKLEKKKRILCFRMTLIFP